ncbi:SET domain protein [Geopyxis carbonaria]|nr:SET domain protein [Geopyxis carbonaria]
MAPSKSTALPKSWPADLPYLSCPQTTSLPRSLLGKLNLTPSKPSALVRIRAITAPATHPAIGQSGLFATKRLPAKSFVLPYYGRYHTSDTTDPQSDYDIWLDRELDVAVDASACGNEGRFVNDYRGIRGGANVEFRVMEGGNGEGKGLRVEIWTISQVEKGEELCVSYGKGFWEGRRTEMKEGEGEKEIKIKESEMKKTTGKILKKKKK